MVRPLREEAVAGYGGQLSERGERRHTTVDEGLRLGASHPGDEAEVVVLDPPLAAAEAEVADPAVGDGPAVRLGLVLDGGEEAFADATVVGVELGDAERLTLAEAVLDVHTLDEPVLDPRDLLGVEEELQHVRRLGGAGELRVDGLVAAARLPLEEVGKPEPGSVREASLVDDVGRAGADLPLGQARRSCGSKCSSSGVGSETTSFLRARAGRSTRPRARSPCGR